MHALIEPFLFAFTLTHIHRRIIDFVIIRRTRDPIFVVIHILFDKLERARAASRTKVGQAAETLCNTPVHLVLCAPPSGSTEWFRSHVCPELQLVVTGRSTGLG